MSFQCLETYLRALVADWAECVNKGVFLKWFGLFTVLALFSPRKICIFFPQFCEAVHLIGWGEGFSLPSGTSSCFFNVLTGILWQKCSEEEEAAWIVGVGMRQHRESTSFCQTYLNGTGYWDICRLEAQNVTQNMKLSKSEQDQYACVMVWHWLKR